MKAIKKIDTLRHFDNQLWIHPWEDISHLGNANRPIIQKAKGIYLYDENGKKIIDGPGGMWCTQIGYGHTEMAKAMAQQIKKLCYSSPFFNTSEIAALAASKIINVAPNDLKHIYFTSDGSSANDSALRFVQFYFNSLGLHQKKHIIAQCHSYHGSTHLSASVSSKDKHDELFDITSNKIHFLPSLLRDETQINLSEDEFLKIKIQEFKDMIANIGPEKIAVFIAEPIQASGGIIIPPQNYLKECSKICKQHSILYISDEVVTGFGRMGHWFASKEVFGIEPDLITCAKGLSSGYVPIGAVLISDKLIQNLKKYSILQNDLIFSAGFTYSGHPVSCAAVIKNMDIMESTHLFEHVQEVSRYFQAQLKQFNDLKMVKNTRGMALLACLECEIPLEDQSNINPKIFNTLTQECLDNGLLVRHFFNKIVLSPPLIITKNQIDKLFDILYQSFKKIEKAYFR